MGAQTGFDIQKRHLCEGVQFLVVNTENVSSSFLVSSTMSLGPSNTTLLFLEIACCWVHYFVHWSRNRGRACIQKTRIMFVVCWTIFRTTDVKFTALENVFMCFDQTKKGALYCFREQMVVLRWLPTITWYQKVFRVSIPVLRNTRYHSACDITSRKLLIWCVIVSYVHFSVYVIKQQ